LQERQSSTNYLYRLLSMSKRASPTDVIDLTENDGGDDANAEKEGVDETLWSLRRRLSSVPSRVAAALRPASKRVKRERMGNKQARDLPAIGKDNSDESAEDDAIEDRKPAAKTTAMGHEEDDVEVMEAPAPRNIPTATTAGAAGSNNSDEIEVVGTVNQVLLPHMRQHCTEEPFLPYTGGTGTAAEGRLDNNMKVCRLCYCYVCDVEASKCPDWKRHCSATDTGPLSTRWIAERNACREKNKQAVESDRKPQAPAATGIDLRFAGVGPFPPDTAGASGSNTRLTKCRKCAWFNKFAHKDFQFDRAVAKAGGNIQRGRKEARWYNGPEYDDTRSRLLHDEIHPTGFMDWCHACGCVASKRDLRKVQSQSYVPSQYSILLGTKTIEFRLKAHDPRDMEKYSEKWAQEAWTYDENEMEQELFDHRLGKFPVLEMIVASMPITTEDKIPSDGRHLENDVQGNQVWGHLGKDDEGTRFKASVSETEAVLIDNHEDGLILKELLKTAPGFGATTAAKPTERLYSYIDGDIKAVWDSNTRKGVSEFLFSSASDPARQSFVSDSSGLIYSLFLSCLFSSRNLRSVSL
jgi:hypothetical protein